MSIFNFDNFPKKQTKKTWMIFFLLIFGVITIGSTLANKITLNSNGASEFGQGLIRAVSCDSNGIKVTPINSFLNQNKSGFFTFNAIQLQHISANCAGMDFILKVYDKSGSAIPISTRDGIDYSEVRIYFHNFDDSIPMSQNDENLNSVSIGGYWAEQFTQVGDGPFVIGTLSNLYEKPGQSIDISQPASTYFELDNEENAVQISFDPSSEIRSGFSDSKNVYRITLETVSHTS